jgi:hypothetical protein
MSVYSVKGKGWRYDFTHQGTRHTEAWFKTKKEAKEAAARKRQELKNPPAQAEILTDTVFSGLVNEYLDHATGSLPAKLTSKKLMSTGSSWDSLEITLPDRSPSSSSRPISRHGRQISITIGTGRTYVRCLPGHIGGGS